MSRLLPWGTKAYSLADALPLAAPEETRQLQSGGDRRRRSADSRLALRRTKGGAGRPIFQQGRRRNKGGKGMAGAIAIAGILASTGVLSATDDQKVMYSEQFDDEARTIMFRYLGKQGIEIVKEFLCGALDVWLPDEEFTKEDAAAMIDQRLLEFEKRFKQAIMQETRALVKGSINANSFREAQLLVRKVTQGASMAEAGSVLETDAFLAYGMAIENDMSHLADLLFLPCIDDGWGSSSCADRINAGATMLFAQLVTTHLAVFDGIFQALSEKAEEVRECLFSASPYIAKMEKLADQVVRSTVIQGSRVHSP
ncbi:unnamed protein product [Symbiodinium sp. CCMP2592]|nr:unnamed protein product [Symbiodinium sp. CCMP2592]